MTKRTCNYCKKEKQEQESKENQEDQEDSQSPSNEIKETPDSSSEQEEDSDNPQPQQTTETGDTPGDQVSQSFIQHEEPEVRTTGNLEDKIRKLTNNDGRENVYVQIPQVNLDTVIAKNFDVHKEIDACFKFQQDNRPEEKLFKTVDQQFKKFKVSAQKEVNYLVKEFECRKAADSYARASTARTGVLDTQKLHTYKFNEDLFRKVSVVPDGKNHGLIFILDWSGSMNNFILDAYKHLLNLVWFCRKVNIPFEVYAFTLECNSYMEVQPNHPLTYKKVAGVIAPEASFRLMNFFTSKTNNRVLEEQLKNIWTACYAYQCHRGVVPRHLELSGSPIGESIMALHSLIPDFQAKNKLQKVNVVFLTDGEGYQNSVTKERKGHYDDTYIGMTKYNKTSIRDRKSGRVYRSFDYNSFSQYAKILLETVKDRFPTVNLINFRITPGRDFQNCYRWYGNGYDNYESAKVEYRKNQCISFNNTGFDQFHVIAATSLAQDEDFKVEEGASKAQIKTAFVKMLGKKKTNKKLLGSFVDLIA